MECDLTLVVVSHFHVTGMSNFCLKMARDPGVSRRKEKPISKSNAERGNSRKKLEVKGEGRELTLGSKEGRVSELISGRTNKWSVESMLRK